MTLEESCDVRNTAQLFIFIYGITNTFELMKELVAMQLNPIYLSIYLSIFA